MLIKNNMENKNYALDKIDEMDYSIKTLLWTVENLPSKIIISDDEIQNQRYTDPYWCVFFTWSSITNTMNYIANESERISWTDLCKIAIEKDLLDPEKGAYIVSSPKLLKELWYITAYWLCRNLEDIKISLFNKKPVQTGSNLIDWIKTKANNNIAVRGSSYWHSFFICGYDDEKEVLICENSYWEESYDNWYFYINYSDIDLLFLSKYVMTDTQEEVKSDYEKFLDRWYINQPNPTRVLDEKLFWTLMERILTNNNLK